MCKRLTLSPSDDIREKSHPVQYRKWRHVSQLNFITQENLILKQRGLQYRAESAIEAFAQGIGWRRVEQMRFRWQKAAKREEPYVTAYSSKWTRIARAMEHERIEQNGSSSAGDYVYWFP